MLSVALDLDGGKNNGPLQNVNALIPRTSDCAAWQRGFVEGCKPAC